MRRALIVVDMLNDFIDPGGALTCGPAGVSVVSHVMALLRLGQARGDLIVFACDAHSPDDPEFALWPRHCVTGTSGAELYGELRTFYEEYRGVQVRYLAKSTYDAFYATDLDKLLRDNGVDEVMVAGVCTSICCYATASGAYYRRYPVFIDPRAMADLTPEAHDFAVQHMQNVLRAQVEQEAAV